MRCRKLLLILILLILPAHALAYDSTYTGAQVDASIAAHIGRNTTVADPGSDAEIVTEQAVREALDLKIDFSGGTLTGELVLDELGIEGQPTDAITDCTGFAATGGGIFYDDSEGKWKKCEDNVLSDLDTGGTGSVDTTGTVNADEISVFSDADTLKALTEAEFKTAYNLEPGTDFYSVSAADAAFEAAASNDFDPDRLVGDSGDNNLIDAEVVEISGATTETSIAADDLVLIYDTSATANRAMTRGNFVTGIGAGQAVIFDIEDDGGNDSTDVGEIATTGDTNSIFTEPTPDKILIDFGNNWPAADTAVAAASQVITDNAIVTVDQVGAADNDIAKFTANGVEGRSYAETRTDLGIDTAANLETSLSLGAYASDILGAADSDALVTLLGLLAGDIPDLSATYEAVDAEISRMDTADTVGADWEWQDGIAQSFGNDNDWEVAYDETTDDRLEYVHTAGAGADVYFDLNDNAADSTYTITNSDATYEANLVVEGDITYSGAIIYGGSGDSYIELSNNASYVGSDYQIFPEGGTWKMTEGSGTEEIILTDVDGATLTGTSWDFSAVTNFEVPNGADPTTDAFGELAADNNAWAASRGAVEHFDGTASTWLVGTLTTDAPSDGQVPKWNTGGTITWENDADSGGAPEWQNVTDPTADATIDHGAGEETNFTYTGNYTTGSQFLIHQLTGNPSGGVLFEARAADTDTEVARLGDGTNYLTVAQNGNTSWGGSATVTLPNNTITNAMMGDNSVDSDDYVDGSVDSVHLANDVGGVTTKSTATSYTVGTTDAKESYGGVIYATGAATVTLPAVVARMAVTVITIGAVAVSVDTNASDRMYLDGTALDDGDKATNTSTTGDMIVCTYESAAGWYCASNSWTDGGV